MNKNEKELTKIVITIPMKTYFQLKEKAGELTVKQYVELLLRNIGVREVKLGGLINKRKEGK